MKSVLNNVLYADLTGVFLVVGCTLFISLVNCLSEIPSCITTIIILAVYLSLISSYHLSSLSIGSTEDNSQLFCLLHNGYLGVLVH